MIAVTGTEGKLGSLVLEGLMKEVAPDRLVALVRHPERAARLVARGIRVRQGDYFSPEAFALAFTGIKRLLLATDGKLGQHASHYNRAAIEAAKVAGVKFIAYASLLDGGSNVPTVAAESRITEGLIRSSGISFAILRNDWRIERQAEKPESPLASGVFVSAARDGRIGTAPCADYAAALVAVLTTDGQDGNTYELAGDEPARVNRERERE